MKADAPRLWRREALCRHAGVRPDLVHRLDKAGILARRGIAEGRVVFYDDEGLQRLIRVRELLNAGYPEQDVAHVLGLANAEPERARTRYVGAETLVPAPRHGREELEAAVASGLLSPAAWRDDGAPLFLAGEASRCRCALDLALLGLHEAAKKVAMGETPEGLKSTLGHMKMAAQRALADVDRLAPLSRRQSGR